MSIRLTAYDTLIGSGYQIDKIKHAVVEAIAMNQGLNPLNQYAYELVGGGPASLVIPAFAHPLLVNDPHSHESRIVVDVRSYGEVDPHQKTFKLRVRTEYDFQCLRGDLNTVWVRENPQVLARVSSMPLQLFAGWLAENLAKHYALNPKEQTAVQVLAGAFYLSNFMDETPFDQMTKTRFVLNLTQGLKLSPTFVQPVTDQLTQPIGGLDEFCKMLEGVTESVRFKGFNAGILIPLLGGTWFGVNREVIGVALEHPPTWIAMVVSAATDRTYKNTDLHRRIERLDRQEKGQLMVRAVKALVQSYQ